MKLSHFVMELDAHFSVIALALGAGAVSLDRLKQRVRAIDPVPP